MQCSAPYILVLTQRITTKVDLLGVLEWPVFVGGEIYFVRGGVVFCRLASRWSRPPPLQDELRWKVECLAVTWKEKHEWI